MSREVKYQTVTLNIYYMWYFQLKITLHFLIKKIKKTASMKKSIYKKLIARKETKND